MNKQIKELYTQVCMEQKLPFTVEHNSAVMLDAFANKFAELIVQECVSIVAKRKDQAIDDSWNVDEAMSMAEMDLLEHFGVEE
jgi:hypothetical protein